ncbi:MAG TPA: ADP-ribosylglycohydrolase family protein, partial [Feifaniaceae bacterium]|nr:ADP-ribosylglycohydrolase family protein [Feifaniaceae bacterium]
REIPARSRLYEAVNGVLRWHKEGRPFMYAVDQIHGLWDERNLHHWCHTVPNAMIVAAALIYGAGDFTKTLGLAVSDGFDTDSNGAVAGAIAGAMSGRSGIPAHWRDALRGKLHSSVAGFECMALEELTRRTLAVRRGEIEPDERIKRRYDYRESFE